jgi:hypothetical protein
MQTKERVGDMTKERVVARAVRPPRLEELSIPVRQEPRPEMTVGHLLARLIVVGVGFGIALTGFMVMLSILRCSSAFRCSSSGWP